MKQPKKQPETAFNLHIGAALLLVGLVAGCASTGKPAQEVRDDASLLAAQAALQDATRSNEALAAAPTLSAEVLQALLPGMSLPEEEAEGDRFDIAVDQVPAKDFFRGLMANTGFNVVVHPAVAGMVSLELGDVSVPEVMAVMRDVYGFEYSLGGNLYQVFPDAMRTEVFHVDYPNLTRQGRSEMTVSAGSISDTGSAGQQNSNSRGQDGVQEDNGAGGANRGGSSTMGSQVSTVSTADFWSELQLTLDMLLGDNPGAQVMVTPQAGLVVVRAMPSELRTVRDYLERAEIALQRQVVLEAKIIEVTLNEGFQAGIDWHTFGRAAMDSFSPVTVTDSNGVSTTVGGSNNDVAAQFQFNGNGFLFNPIGSTFKGFFAFGDFEGMIELLETQGTVQVLSSPRIATVNNQKAVIKVGSDEFFVTDISSSTVTAGSSINTNDSAELTPFFSGIALDVTPHVGRDGDVVLHIHPTVSEVREQRKDIGGQSVPLAASTIRESDSIVRASNGQVVVIGGLMQNSSTDNGTSVPLLGRLPLLGKAFRQTQQRSIKSELVILVRPILMDPAAEARELQDAMDRLDRLGARISARGGSSAGSELMRAQSAGR